MSQSNLDRLFALLATTAVVIGVVGGFWLLGSPNRQRQIRADQQRVQDLRVIAQSLRQQARRFQNRGKLVNLPATLAANDRKTDPISGKTYNYQRLDSTQYQLCAEFATDSKAHENSYLAQNFWKHPSGQHCFQLDVLEEPP